MPFLSSPTSAHVAPIVRVAVLAGAAATMATVFFVSRSDVLAEPWVNAVLRSLSIVCAVGVGAVTLSLRPQSRLGPVLVALGFLYAAASLQASSDPLVYNVGRLVLPVSTLALLYASLAFPTGRLEHPGQRRVMAAVAVVMVDGVDGRGADLAAASRLQRPVATARRRVRPTRSMSSTRAARRSSHSLRKRCRPGRSS